MNLGYTAIAVVLVAGVAGGYGFIQGRASGQAEIQQKWDAERVQLEAEHAKAQQLAREREQLMQSAADQLRQEKDREIRNLNARASALNASLHDRKERAAVASGSVSGAAGAGGSAASCTGAGLSREDAQFLAGEAARADELRVSLKQCIAQYQAVKGK